nr:hypothetical protein [Amnibacterium sp.]
MLHPETGADDVDQHVVVELRSRPVVATGFMPFGVVGAVVGRPAVPLDAAPAARDRCAEEGGDLGLGLEDRGGDAVGALESDPQAAVAVRSVLGRLRPVRIERGLPGLRLHPQEVRRHRSRAVDQRPLSDLELVGGGAACDRAQHVDDDARRVDSDPTPVECGGDVSPPARKLLTGEGAGVAHPKSER